MLTVMLAAVFIIPISGHAYFTTDQQAVRLTNNHVLFTISYRFGFEKRELFMPILAKQDLRDVNIRNRVGFELVSNVDTSNYPVSAIVLTKSADAHVADDLYRLEPGNAAVFTLMAIVTLPDGANTDADMALHVTHLPFTMVTEDGKQVKAQLNPSELEKYLTPILSLKNTMPLYPTSVLPPAFSIPDGPQK